MEKKILLQEISDSLAAREKLTKKKADVFARTFFEVIAEAIERDSFVKIKGFGTFKLVTVGERESVNINTGERFQISSHTKISFTPDNYLRDLVNRPFSHFQSVVLNEDTDIEELENVDKELEETLQGEEHGSEFENETAEASISEENISGESERPAGDTEPQAIPDPGPSDQPFPSASREDEWQKTEDSLETPAEENPDSELPRTVEEPVQADPSAAPACIETGLPPASEKEPEEAAAPAPSPKPLPASEEEDSDHAVQQTAATAAPANNAAEPSPKENATSEKGITYTYAPDSSRPRINWWKLIVEATAVLLLMLLSYFAGYFRLFCPCEYMDLFQKQPASSIPAKTPAPAHPAQPVVHADSTHSTPADTTARRSALPAEKATPTSPKAQQESTSNPQQAPPRQQELPADVEYVVTGTRESHIVQKGENIYSIAKDHYGNKNFAPYIISHNRLSNPDIVTVGTVLKIPELKQR